MRKDNVESGGGNILHTAKRRKANWIGHMLCRNCLVKHIVEGKIEGQIKVTGRRGRRRNQVLDDVKETRRYWELKEGARERTLEDSLLEETVDLS